MSFKYLGPPGLTLPVIITGRRIHARRVSRRKWDKNDERNKGFGVMRIDNTDVRCNIVHINSRTKGIGVRQKENVLYYDVVPSPCRNVTCSMLEYNKPCLCGSKKHSRIRHRDCPLNPQYEDV